VADVYELRERYKAAKEGYRIAGNAARGTPPGSTARVAYERARENYQQAGRALRAARVRT